jgi:hypothetical protein
MDGEWSEWIEHDGTGCPLPIGTMCQREYGSGDIITGIRRGVLIRLSHGYHGPRYLSSWDWSSPGRQIPIIRYRYRKPAGLLLLERIAEHPREHEPA